jgi:hypothetical protein
MLDLIFLALGGHPDPSRTLSPIVAVHASATKFASRIDDDPVPPPSTAFEREAVRKPIVQAPAKVQDPGWMPPPLASPQTPTPPAERTPTIDWQASGLDDPERPRSAPRCPVCATPDHDCRAVIRQGLKASTPGHDCAALVRAADDDRPPAPRKEVPPQPSVPVKVVLFDDLNCRYEGYDAAELRAWVEARNREIAAFARQQQARQQQPVYAAPQYAAPSYTYTYAVAPRRVARRGFRVFGGAPCSGP